MGGSTVVSCGQSKSLGRCRETFTNRSRISAPGFQESRSRPESLFGDLCEGLWLGGVSVILAGSVVRLAGRQAWNEASNSRGEVVVLCLLGDTVARGANECPSSLWGNLRPQRRTRYQEDVHQRVPNNYRLWVLQLRKIGVKRVAERSHGDKSVKRFPFLFFSFLFFSLLFPYGEEKRASFLDTAIYQILSQ